MGARNAYQGRRLGSGEVSEMNSYPVIVSDIQNPDPFGWPMVFWVILFSVLIGAIVGLAASIWRK